jgi:putative transposase
MKKQAGLPQLFLTEGTVVTHEDREYVITGLADLSVVFAKETASGQELLLRIDELKPPRKIGEAEPAPTPERDLQAISAEEWRYAERCRDLIAPLLNGEARAMKGAASQIAATAGVSRATIYRWVQDFRETGTLTSFLPNYAGRGGRGGKRLDGKVEALIQDAIENFYETEQKPSLAATIEEIHRRCKNANLPAPAVKSIRRRLLARDARAATKRRMGEAVAHDRYDPLNGHFPDAIWPLAIVQIDHTVLPAMIVDDTHRKPIRRAWLTLAIDAHSRMCLGMYLSLDPPSAMSAGMCVSHAILPKEKWLNRIGVTSTDWPCWGVMGALHMDNAKEFRGDMLRVACHEYDIDHHLRPVKKPRYGAFIERMMGTVTTGLKTVKGATFSGPAEKGEYDAEGNACLTFSEVEKWLVLFFAKYHRSFHEGIGTTPLTKFREALLGKDGKPGRGLPARQINEEKLRIDFMPFEERTVQNYGVLFDVHYYHDVLRPYINQPDPNYPRHTRKFRFHRDPRDISVLYFFDEIGKRYVAIPYRDTSLPPASLWEYKEAKKRAKQRGISPEDEKAVFSLLNEMRALEAEAAGKQKSARRAQQRRTEHAKARKAKAEDLPTVGKPSPTGPPPAVRGYDPDAVRPLDDD